VENEELVRTPPALIVYRCVVETIDEVLKQGARLGFCVHGSFLFLSVDGVVTCRRVSRRCAT
jgi:hypothetical protein